MSLDREALSKWYRQAMGDRIGELRALRDGIVAGDAAARDEARAVAQALRGSGATFGFPDVTESASLVEMASDGELLRRMEGLVERLHSVRSGDSDGYHGEWLRVVIGDRIEGAEPLSGVEEAWRVACERSGLAPAALAGRIAEHFGLAVADLASPGRSAQRLVPEALMRERGIVPLAEDSATIIVATPEPTALATEAELLQLTGRRPIFVVAPPAAVRRALENALGEATGADGEPRARRRDRLRPTEPTVLVVDDEPGTRLAERSVLEKDGYLVLEAGDGVEALEALDGGLAVSLIVADLNMPRMDGLELLWQVRDRPEWLHIPIVVVTGETDELLEARVIQEGADDYIRKPLDPRLFLARVHSTIRRAEV